MTQEERKNIEHALLHLRANGIADYDKPGPCVSGGWYAGNREHFVERHRKAITMFQDMLDEEDMTIEQKIARHKAYVDSLPLYEDRKRGDERWKDEHGHVYAYDKMYLIDGPAYEQKGE
jgi:hypothetical protein